MGTPRVSLIVVAFNISRELPRTLASVTSPYQLDVPPEDIEIIVVDNGSTPAIDPAIANEYDRQVRVIRVENAPPSPAHAINRGLAEARADVIGVMIDGARLATPGLLAFGSRATMLFAGAVVASLGWYLGADFQRFSMAAGYSRSVEDDLLASIDWPNDGYRLFEIGTLDESSVNGWFAPISESNALFAARDTWTALGGYDERFDRPGGGLVNLDTFRRAVELEGARLVVLLGEGTFHQLHGGVSTNTSDAVDRWDGWAAQYFDIRGRPYEVPNRAAHPVLIGPLPPVALGHLARAALFPVAHHPDPLGNSSDLLHESPDERAARPDPVLTGMMELVAAEIAADRLPVAAMIARRARSYDPESLPPQRVLRYLAGHSPQDSVPHEMIPYRDVALARMSELLDQTG